MVSIINITLIALRGAHDIADPSSPGNKKLANLLAIVSSQTAVRTCYFAQAVEDPSSLRVLVDWESIEAQEAFLASEAGAKYLEGFNAISNGDRVSYHVYFSSPSPKNVLVGEEPHMTEVITAYFPVSYYLEDQAQFAEGMEKLFLACKKYCPGFKSGIGGWAGEKVRIPAGTDEALVYVALNGWTSVEAHLKFRETKEFEDNIHWLRYAKDRRALEVVHAKFTENPT